MNANALRLCLSICCVFVLVAICGTAGADPETREKVLAASEKLAIEGKYCEALKALAPLLNSPTISTQRERALWQAKGLCDVISASGELEKLAEAAKPEGRMKDWYKEFELFKELNKLGASFTWDDHWEDYFGDGQQFMKRLIADYPDSRYRPSAEYYLIGYASDTLSETKETLKKLHAYLKKYERLPIREGAMAQLRIAQICDNLSWFVLKAWSSGDPTKDNADSAHYKAEALKYYTRFLINGAGQTIDENIDVEASAMERIRDIPKGIKSRFIIIGEGC